MPRGLINEEQIDERVVLLAQTTLGSNNQGSLGPTGESRQQIEDGQSYAVNEVSRAEYARLPSRLWVCIDGRLVAVEVHKAPEGYANPQTAGSMAITDLSVAYMMSEDRLPVSRGLALTTTTAISDDCLVMSHGGHDRADCAANKKQREALAYNVANIDIVAPVAWQLGEFLGIDSALRMSDVYDLIITGGHAAADDELWDVTPLDKVGVQESSGAYYVDLKGDHVEKVIRFDVSDMAFDEDQFVRDHLSEAGDVPIMAFNVSGGLLKAEYLRRAKLHDESVYQAAKMTMAAVLWNIGVAKLLVNRDMPVAIVGSSTAR